MPRTQDSIWIFFERSKGKKTGYKARCKKCKVEIQGIPERMRKHHRQCGSQEDDDISIVTEEVQQQDCGTAGGSGGNTSSTATSGTMKRNLPDPEPEEMPPAKLKKCSSLDKFIVKTSAEYKESLDEQVARFIFATNSSFTTVEHPEFIKLMTMLRNGYQPPSR